MTKPSITDARQLVEAVELADVGCFELFGARGVVRDGERTVVGPGTVDDIKVLDERHTLEVFWQSDAGRFLVRLTFELETDVGDLRVGMQAEWDLGGLAHEDVAIEAEEDFVNKVAVMAIVPYIRAALSDLAIRTFGRNVTLGLIRPGQLEFESKRRSDDPSGEQPVLNR